MPLPIILIVIASLASGIVIGQNTQHSTTIVTQQSK